MNKVIARHKFWLHQTECIISTAYVEVLHEYQTVVMYRMISKKLILTQPAASKKP